MLQVTVCQLPNDPQALTQAWLHLCEHTQFYRTDILLLPEMIFSPWLAANKRVEPEKWQASIEQHNRWLARLPETGAKIILGSRPVIRYGRRLNEGFCWNASDHYLPLRAKTYLPNEPRFWEASWYQRGPVEFPLHDSPLTKIGMLICTELWFNEQARFLGRKGAQILVNPRATERFSVEKWLVGGRAAAIVSGAFCLSSNHSGNDPAGFEWGGGGWVIDPDGEVLARTDGAQPFVTVSIDLALADAAKKNYPRDVIE